MVLPQEEEAVSIWGREYDEKKMVAWHAIETQFSLVCGIRIGAAESSRLAITYWQWIVELAMADALAR